MLMISAKNFPFVFSEKQNCAKYENLHLYLHILAFNQFGSKKNVCKFVDPCEYF